MAVTGPDFLALQVRDLEASAAFYESRLDLTRAPGSPPGAVVFQTAPIPFAVRVPLPDVDLDSVPRPGLGVALWMAADDVTALNETLLAAGVAVVQPPTPGPFGLMLTFTDPDGYAVTVHEAA